jgi:excisionase family DNA binding protein
MALKSTISKDPEVCPHCGKELQPSKSEASELKDKTFLSIAETCKLIGISRRTVYRMLERGELTAGKAGKRTILRRADIDKLFEGHEKLTPVAVRKSPRPAKQTDEKKDTAEPDKKVIQKQPKSTVKEEAAQAQPVKGMQLDLFGF